MDTNLNNKPEEEQKEDEIHLLDYLIVLAKRKKLILKITLSVFIVSSIAAFLSQVSFYEVETSILPPRGENRGFANQLMRDMGFLPQLASGASFNNQEILVEIFKSRTFSDRIMNRFNLKGFYEDKDSDHPKKAFFKDIWIEPDFTEKKRTSLLREKESPLIKIHVKNQDAKMAADIANGIVEELQLFINNLAITEASKRRLFFEEQLKQTKEDLFRAEEAMRDFQEKTGVFKVEAQAGAVLEGIAKLRAQIAAKEVELSVMRSYSTPNNPDLQKVTETIKGLRAELAKLEQKGGNNPDPLMPTGRMASVGTDYTRKFRDLKFNETLYEIMVKQYEMAKIDESKDSFLIQVIDKAVPPEKKSRTRTWGGKKAMTTTVLAFLFSCVLAFFMEYRERDTKNERLEILKGYLSFRKKT